MATLPAIDSVINQINTIYQPSLGPLSMLQAARGIFLVIFVWIAVTSRRPGRVSRPIGRIVLAVTACLTLFAIREFWVRGEMFLSTLVAFTQIVYWLLVWYAAASWIRTPEDGITVIKGLTVGALLTAASVYYGYAAGVSTVPYSQEGVAASSGFFVSGKGIAGTLDSAALLAAYLSSRRFTWTLTAGSLMCLGAAFLTYARAGMVALVAALTWLSIWSFCTRLKTQSSWVRRLLLAMLCGGGILVSTIGTGDLVRRWSDLQSEDKAGSGRLVIWNAALDRFYDGTPAEQLLGCGFQSMTELTDSVVGVAIHTHNDVLDMLLVGGFTGLLILALVLAGFVLQIRRIPLAAAESATGVAILLVLLYQGFFTGQLLMPDVMTDYVVGLSAVLACRSA